MGRESINLRGQVFELDSNGKAGADGMPVSLTVRGVTPQGDATETFSITGGKASWKSQVDAGSAAYAKPAFYSTQNGPIDTGAWLFERLLASPDHTLALLPGGQAKAEKLTTLTVGEGAAKQEITAWSITGIANFPIPMWADAKGKFFGFVLFLSWLPEQYASEQLHMQEAQTKALAGHRRQGAHRFGPSGEGSQGSGRREDHRWQGQDAGSGLVGLPHARGLGLHGRAGALDGGHVAARSGQRRLADHRSARARGAR
jgi:hypothetical protein